MTEFTPLAKTPCDIFLIQCPSDFDSKLREPAAKKLLNDLETKSMGCCFRGISIDRLSTVLKRGIDVEPADACFYVADLDKAMEYGEWPKVILALRYTALKKTFKEISSTSSEEEKEAVRREFPTIIQSPYDETMLWCTRLNSSAPQIATEYEIAYAWWIPDDPWAALKSIFILKRPEDQIDF